MLVSMTSFPYEESRMTTWDFIIVLFYHIDQQMHDMPKHPEAQLWSSEVVTLGLLHALKGVGNRPFYRWLPTPLRAWSSPKVTTSLGQRCASGCLGMEGTIP